MASLLTPTRTRTTQSFQWEWETDGGWQQYDDTSSLILERERERLDAVGGQVIKLSIGKCKYTVNLDTMTQTNDTTKKIRNIRRNVAEPSTPSLPVGRFLSLHNPTKADEVMRLLAESRIIRELRWYLVAFFFLSSFDQIFFICSEFYFSFIPWSARSFTDVELKAMAEGCREIMSLNLMYIFVTW